MTLMMARNTEGGFELQRVCERCRQIIHGSIVHPTAEDEDFVSIVDPRDAPDYENISLLHYHAVCAPAKIDEDTEGALRRGEL